MDRPDPLLLRRSEEEERDGRPEAGSGAETPGDEARIRCPKCGFRPRARDRWGCTCGCWWNTFDTGGKCPDCGHQWRDTQCLRCGHWSPHPDWYEPPGP